ncbi:UNVERIFIED_CONTAM: hypothetical protein RMT77_005214 [Armadillidium vulgare]
MTSNLEILPQIIATICATLGGSGMGSIIGFASSAGLVLTDPSYNSTLQITDNQNSWVSSVSNLGAVIGCPITGFSLNYFGRKKTIIMASVAPTIGWILIISAQNFGMLLVGRIISGMYCGMISIAANTYVGEIASPHIRGTLGTAFQTMNVIGILFGYSMGAAFDDFRWMAGLCAIPPILCSILMFFNKETPIYLLSQGKEKEAEKSLRHFRGENYDGIDDEMYKLKIYLEESQKNKARITDIKKSYNLKPFSMSMGLFFFQQFVGIGAVLFNMTLIFQSVGFDLSENMSTIIVGVVQVLALVPSVILMDITGRRSLLTGSAIFMIISEASLGLYFYFADRNPSVAENVSWLPLASLIIYILAFNVGFGPIPWLMAGELFSPEIKDLCISIATMFNWIFAFIVTVSFQPLQSLMYDFGVYWMYGGFCILSLLFSIFVVFETKGKTLAEINAHFGSPSGAERSEDKTVSIFAIT